MDITVDRADCGRIHDLAYPLAGNWSAVTDNMSGSRHGYIGWTLPL
jgi:hypothetical protein